MQNDDWDELLAHIIKLIIQKANEEVEGEFPAPKEVIEKLSEFRANILDSNDDAAEIKCALIDYTSYRVKTTIN